MARKRADDVAFAARVAAILGAIFAFAALVLVGFRASFSVMVGAAIAVSNLVMLRAIVRALLTSPEDEEQGTDKEGPPRTGDEQGDERAEKATNADHKAAGRRGGAAWGIFAVFKILILFGSIYLLLTLGLVDPIALVVGYGVLPLGIATASLWSSLRRPT